MMASWVLAETPRPGVSREPAALQSQFKITIIGGPMEKELIYERFLEHEKNLHLARFKGDALTTKREARMRVILLRRLAVEALKDADVEPGELAQIGKKIIYTLDKWKKYGATLDELCNLCNQQEVKIPPCEQCYPFSVLVGKYALDDKGGADANAPLTKAIQAANIHRFMTALRTAI